MTGLARQLRISFRGLARSPGYSVPAVLILAVGMTAATAIFTVVDSIVFRPLAIPRSERVVIVCEDHERLGGACIASPGNTEDLRSGSGTLAELGIGRGWMFSLTDAEGSRGVRGGLATSGFLRALGVIPPVGRLFWDDELGPDNDEVVLLSHGYWVTHHGSDPSVVGTVLTLDGAPHEIIGVLPRWFEAPFDLGGIEMWRPPHFDPTDPEVRGWRGFRAIGRLADEASVAAATSELTALYAGIRERHEEVDDEWHLRVQPLLRVVVGDTRVVLFAFLGGAGLLLLIVCANTANLLLARGLSRRDEFAVRTALGAGRRRLVGDILTESFALAATATVVSLALASGATQLLLRFAPPETPRLDEVVLDLRVLIFSAMLAVLVTATFALIPALRVTSKTVGRLARARTTRGSRRVQNMLVVSEIALCLVLLGSAGVLTRSFLQYLSWDPGFEYETALAVSVFVDTGMYPTQSELISFYEQAEARLEAAPGVLSAASASAGPLFGGGDGATSFVPEGADETAAAGSARWFDVGPGYFETLGLAVVAGRGFTDADGPDAPRVAVVNEAVVRSAWPDGRAVGRVLRLPELDLAFEIIGVVRDVRPLTPGQAPYPEIYWTNRQLTRPATFFLIRVASDASAAAPVVTDALEQLAATVSIGTPRPLAEEAGRALVRPRFQASILLALAVAALILSAVGVYAVISYSVSSRTRELGIRVALGAADADIVTLMTRSSVVVTAIGVALGLGGSLLVARVIQGLVHGVSPTDPVSLFGASLVVVLSTGLATVLPVRRALNADPRSVIRSD